MQRQLMIHFNHKCKLGILMLLWSLPNVFRAETKSPKQDRSYSVDSSNHNLPTKTQKTTSKKATSLNANIIQLKDPIYDPNKVTIQKSSKTRSRPKSLRRAEKSKLKFSKKKISGRLKRPRVAFDKQPIPLEISDRRLDVKKRRRIFELPRKDL